MVDRWRCSYSSCMFFLRNPVLKHRIICREIQKISELASLTVRPISRSTQQCVTNPPTPMDIKRHIEVDLPEKKLKLRG